LSSPSNSQIGKFTKLAWSTIWNEHTALVPSMAIGRRRRRDGGLGFLQPQAEIYALLAQWIPNFLLRTTLWTPIFQHAFARHPGGLSNLYHTMRIGPIRRFPAYLREILQAWAKLRPHWQPDITTWTLADALAFPVPQTYSAANPNGVTLGRLFTTDFSTSRLVLMTPEVAAQRFSSAAPGRVKDAVAQLQPPSDDRPPPDTLVYQLVQLIASASPPYPSPTPFATLLTLLLAADTAVTALTTSAARRYLDLLDHVPQALDWNARSLGRLAIPPKDIWTRLWRGPLLPRHRETWYKMLMNALPLGTRIWNFAPDSLLCHACSAHNLLVISSLSVRWPNRSGVTLLVFSSFLSQSLFLRLFFLGPPVVLDFLAGNTVFASRLVMRWRCTPFGQRIPRPSMVIARLLAKPSPTAFVIFFDVILLSFVLLVVFRVD
jgi:hypothetical protein